VGTDKVQSSRRLAQAAPEPRVPGRLKGRIHISLDFDEPLPEEILATFRGERR
jgi:hypothetical protein